MSGMGFRVPTFLAAPWLLVLTMQVVLGVMALRPRASSVGQKQQGSLWLSGIVSVFPLLTLVVIVRVFVIGGSSNVAQFPDPYGSRLWATNWYCLFWGNVIATMMLLAILALPPYPPRRWLSFLSRVFAVISSGYALYTVLRFHP